MTSFNFTDEQLAALQQKGWLSAGTATQLQQKPALGIRPDLAAAQMAGRVTPQTAYTPIKGGAVGGVDVPKTTIHEVAHERKKPLTEEQQTAQTWLSLQDKAIRPGPAIPVNTQVPLKLSHLPSDAQKMVDGQMLGWDPRDLNDDEYILALKLVHKNQGNMSPEERAKVFDYFRSAAQDRPDLIRKLKALQASETNRKPKKESHV